MSNALTRGTPRDLVGAATRYTVKTAARKGTKAIDSGWQEAAWEFYSTTPEVRFGATYIGNAMGNARLYAGRMLPDQTIEAAPDDHRAAQLVAAIAGGPDGQAQILKAFGAHLTVAGEGWILIRPNPDADDDAPTGDSGPEDDLEWRVLSVLEMVQKSGALEAEIEGETHKIPPYDPDTPDDPDDPIAIRVWEPHPRRHMEADSPVRASLELLEELKLLNAAVKAITRSRLTGRGVLLIPQGARFPTKPGTSEAEDDLIDVFMTIAETAYRDPESAAATVPIILEVPAESIGEIKRLTFESDFDELAIQLRKEAITRFANGLEIPAEILLGMGDVNHWGLWAMTDAAISLGIEPRIDTVAHALTTQYLRPALRAEGVPDWRDWTVVGDVSQLRASSNQPQTALEVHAVGAISDEALRRVTGFDEADAPDKAPNQPVPGDDETTDDGQTDDETTDGDEDGTVTPLLPVNDRKAPPPIRPPGQAPARTAAVVVPSAALLAAADGLIWNAMNRAGEKLRRTPACPRSRRAEANRTPTSALHTLLRVDEPQIDQWGLLDEAFDRTGEIAERYGADAECLREALDGYCRALLATGQQHSWAYVRNVVADCTRYEAEAS